MKLSSNSQDTSTFGGLTSEFSNKEEAGIECSFARNFLAESSPQGILPLRLNVRNTMTRGELEVVHFSCKFLGWIEIRLPRDNEKVDDVLPDGWEPFYLRHFEISLRFRS